MWHDSYVTRNDLFVWDTTHSWATWDMTRDMSHTWVGHMWRDSTWIVRVRHDTFVSHMGHDSWHVSHAIHTWLHMTCSCETWRIRRRPYVTWLTCDQAIVIWLMTCHTSTPYTRKPLQVSFVTQKCHSWIKSPSISTAPFAPYTCTLTCGSCHMWPTNAWPCVTGLMIWHTFAPYLIHVR